MLYSLARVLEIARAGMHNVILFSKDENGIEVSNKDITILSKVTRKSFSDNINLNSLVVTQVPPCLCGNLFVAKCYCTDLNIKYHFYNMPNTLINLSDMYVPLIKEDSIVDEEKVSLATEIQNKRYFQEDFKTNSQLTRNCFERYCKMEEGAKELLEEAKEMYTASDFEKIIRVSRTIADLDKREIIYRYDVAEALGYISCYVYLRGRGMNV